MIIKGKLSVERMNPGTKSEGMFAFLTTGEGEQYRLYRPGTYPVNDEYFYPFDNLQVEVDGEVEEENFIAVNSIETDVNQKIQ